MSQSLDRIFLEKAEFQAIVGAFNWEQNAPRTVLIDVTLFVDIQSAVAEDDLTKTVDYSNVYNTIVAYGQARSYQLIETLAEDIAQGLLKTYPRILKLDLTVYKPGAVPQAKTVGITITRFQS